MIYSIGGVDSVQSGILCLKRRQFFKYFLKEQWYILMKPYLKRLLNKNPFNKAPNKYFIKYMNKMGKNCQEWKSYSKQLFSVTVWPILLNNLQLHILPSEMFFITAKTKTTELQTNHLKWLSQEDCNQAITNQWSFFSFPDFCG